MSHSKNVATEREPSLVDVVDEDGYINSQVICNEVDGSQGCSEPHDESTLSSTTDGHVSGVDDGEFPHSLEINHAPARESNQLVDYVDDLRAPSLDVSDQSNDGPQPSEKERFEPPHTCGFNQQSDGEHEKRSTPYELVIEKPKHIDEPDKESVVS